MKIFGNFINEVRFNGFSVRFRAGRSRNLLADWFSSASLLEGSPYLRLPSLPNTFRTSGCRGYRRETRRVRHLTGLSCWFLEY